MLNKKEELPKRKLCSPLKPNFFKPHVLEEELLKALPQLLKDYDGKPVDTSALAALQQDGMDYTDSKTYNNTDIGITLKLDITKKEETYRQHYASVPGASFSLYLMWTLIQSMQQIPGFNFRYIGGQWYEFNNLPLFTTVSINGELNNCLCPKVVGATWPEMCQLYFSAKKNAEGKTRATTFAYPIYAIATHITNVSLPFKALSIPTPRKGIEIERPMFVLGERMRKNDKVFMPLHAKLPHASLHPGLFQELLSKWKSIEENPLAEDLGMKAKL